MQGYLVYFPAAMLNFILYEEYEERKISYLSVAAISFLVALTHIDCGFERQ